MKQLYGGIDIGSESHHIIIIDESDKIHYDSKVPHRLSALAKAIERFKELGKSEGKTLTFAIEGKNGYSAPFDRLLTKGGFCLYNVDNLKLRRFRDVFGAEWRNDKRDAAMLAKMLKLRDHVDSENERAFIRVEPVPETHEKLKILSRHQQTLIGEKIRIQNRLKKRLLEICPGILEIGDTDSKRLLRLLTKYPDFSKYKKLTVDSLLKIKMIGKNQAPFIWEKVHNLHYVDDIADVYKPIIVSYTRRLLDLHKEIAILDTQLEKLGDKSTSVTQLRTIPGVATKLSSRLIGELGEIDRFAGERQLAVYCGIACIDDESGKRKRTRVVYKANKICKATMIEIAGCTIRYVPESRAYYARKRAEGKTHNHALRCLARQLIKVIFLMLKENRSYMIRDEVKKAA
ncbi:MAG: IS110 family transposase [Deltaproteobacteria bacterium]|nr:IS110 family transposase [Deltaproteobacteria bacterium]